MSERTGPFSVKSDREGAGVFFLDIPIFYLPVPDDCTGPLAESWSEKCRRMNDAFHGRGYVVQRLGSSEDVV